MYLRGLVLRGCRGKGRGGEEEGNEGKGEGREGPGKNVKTRAAKVASLPLIILHDRSSHLYNVHV